MKPSISIITIGVDDLERAFVFYRALFDIAEEQIGAGEDHVAFFFDDGTPGFVLSHQASSAAEVDEILRKVLAGGGAIVTEGTQSEWGYSAYFEDSEGNIWELMAQPPAN